jgi:hypothetical protein
MNEPLIQLNAILVEKGLNICFSAQDNHGFITVYMIKNGITTTLKSNATPPQVTMMCEVAIKILS